MSGWTAQGLAYWASEQPVYVSTTQCWYCNDTLVVVHVPAGTLGNPERLAVAWFADTREVHWLESWARTVELAVRACRASRTRDGALESMWLNPCATRGEGA